MKAIRQSKSNSRHKTNDKQKTKYRHQKTRKQKQAQDHLQHRFYSNTNTLFYRCLKIFLKIIQILRPVYIKCVDGIVP